MDSRGYWETIIVRVVFESPSQVQAVAVYDSIYELDASLRWKRTFNDAFDSIEFGDITGGAN
jgi:hypothetical protein